jgi:hypothetical protein
MPFLRNPRKRRKAQVDEEEWNDMPLAELRGNKAALATNSIIRKRYDIERFERLEGE